MPSENVIHKKRTISRIDRWVPLLFIAPSLTGFFIFYLLPFLLGFYYSLVENMFSNRFVGISNYLELFKSQSFLSAGSNTLFFTCLCIPLNLIISLTIALLVNENIYARSVFRTLLVSPLVIPVASVVQFWQIAFHKNGVINAALAWMGKDGVNWLNSDFAICVILTIYLWKNLGYSVVLILAGLQNIPRQYYESAEIDGAGHWIKFVKITFVYLTPTTFFVFIMSIINSFKVFRETYLMAGDYPNESLYMLQHYMNNTFIALDYQKLTSAAFIMGFVIYLLVLLLYMVERKVGDSIV